MRSSAPVISTLPPRVVGHRGACGHAPENTLASFRKAAELGAAWVEFDVHLSRDRVPVVIHDDTLERTTSGRGQVGQTDWEDLRALDAGSWFGPAFAGETLPDLTGVIALLADLGLGANIEIKPSPGMAVETGRVVAEQLRAEWPSHLPPPLLSSFKIDSLRAAQAVAPEIDRALLVTGIPADWERQLTALECPALHCDHSPLTPERVAEIISSGFALRCYTVNDGARARDLLHWGVGSVVTDFPDRILAADVADA